MELYKVKCEMCEKAFLCVAMLLMAPALLQFVRNAMQLLSIINLVVEGGTGLDRSVWLINAELTRSLISNNIYYLLAYLGAIIRILCNVATINHS